MVFVLFRNFWSKTYNTIVYSLVTVSLLLFVPKYFLLKKFVAQVLKSLYSVYLSYDFGFTMSWNVTQLLFFQVGMSYISYRTSSGHERQLSYLHIGLLSSRVTSSCHGWHRYWKCTGKHSLCLAKNPFFKWHKSLALSFNWHFGILCQFSCLQFSCFSFSKFCYMLV